MRYMAAVSLSAPYVEWSAECRKDRRIMVLLTILSVMTAITMITLSVMELVHDSGECILTQVLQAGLLTIFTPMYV